MVQTVITGVKIAKILSLEQVTLGVQNNKRTMNCENVTVQEQFLILVHDVSFSQSGLVTLG